MVESLRLEFDLTPKDMEKVQEEVLERKIRRVGKWFCLTFVGVGMAFGVISTYLREAPAERPFMVAFVLTVVAVVLAFQWWRRRRARPAIVVEIDADEVRITMSGTCQIMPWSVLGTLAETSNYFVLPQRKGTFSYVLPKRAFPDEDSQEWLRAVAESATTGERAEPQLETAAPSTDYRSVTLEFRLAYRDYLDRSIASWATRGFAAFVTLSLFGSFITVTLNPPKDAIFQWWQMLPMLVPFWMLLALMPVILSATVPWMNNRRSLTDQIVTLSPAGLDSVFSGGHVVMDWGTPVFYKETPWSFIIWCPSTGGWLLLPKRAFSTVDGANRCRDLLGAHATRSTWYFGR